MDISPLIDPANQEPMAVSILAPSERQAMDWSLVLTSQGIDSTLMRSPETGQWTLLVEAADQARAQEAIHQYRLENRRWGWRQELPWSGITFHWGVLCWCVAQVLFHILESLKGFSLHPAGQLDSAAVFAGQWWRLFTAVTLHADAAHLGANATVGFVLLGLAMARFGAGCGLLAAYAAGVAGNVAGLFLYTKPHFSLGASGMIMGALGLTTVQSLALWRHNPRAAKVVLSGILSGAMLFILLGLNPESDVVAHLGGFLAGGLLGGAMVWLPPPVLHDTRLNAVSLLVLCLTVIGTWLLAIFR
jgi:rhomboid protease GluP